MLRNSFIIAGLLDLSAFPGLVRSLFFTAQVFFHVCLDVIRYIMALFLLQIIGVGGVCHHLKASGMTRTHYLLLKQY